MKIFKQEKFLNHLEGIDDRELCDSLEKVGYPVDHEDLKEATCFFRVLNAESDETIADLTLEELVQTINNINKFADYLYPEKTILEIADRINERNGVCARRVL